MTNKEIESLWNDLYPRVYGYFMKRIANRDDVEDLTSITLTSFLDKLDNHSSSIENRYAYLWKIAYYQFLQFINSKKKTPVPIDLTNDFYSEVDLEYETSEINNSILAERILKIAKKELKDIDYQIFSESILNGKNSTELSKKFNIKPGTIRQKLSRTIKKLRQQFN